MSVYESLSVMLQFSMWTIAFITLVITLLIYFSKRK